MGELSVIQLYCIKQQVVKEIKLFVKYKLSLFGGSIYNSIQSVKLVHVVDRIFSYKSALPIVQLNSHFRQDSLVKQIKQPR